MVKKSTNHNESSDMMIKILSIMFLNLGVLGFWGFGVLGFWGPGNGFFTKAIGPFNSCKNTDIEPNMVCTFEYFSRI